MADFSTRVARPGVRVSNSQRRVASPHSCPNLNVHMDPIQVGFWVPNRIFATAKYLAPLRRHIAQLHANGALPALTPAVAALKQWVTNHSVYRMWVTHMIEQANDWVYNTATPAEKHEILKDGDTLYIASFDELFILISQAVSTSPSYADTAMVGTPLNGLLAVSMATEAGTALFHDTTFNEQFKKVLDSWNVFLKSSASLDKLDIQHPEKPGSWISTAAWAAGVWTQMQHNRDLPGYGFASWNDFFIRKFIPDARQFKGNPEINIDIGCETTPYCYANDLTLDMDFWIKDNVYSLWDMFGGGDNASWAEKFVGGQLYQGFLSATHYHRWHAPLTGKLIKSWVQPGTYFAQRPDQGQNQGTWEGTESQPYLAHVAARAVFIFEHPRCGLVALICIGMVEVSTCYIEPAFRIDPATQPPKPCGWGEEIGHFEFGGSTHCMIFQKDMVLLEDWARNPKPISDNTPPTKMGTTIATAPLKK